MPAKNITIGNFSWKDIRKAAAQARARGELAREVHCRASIARALAALGELDAARAALAEARELAGRIPGRGWSWERIHVEGTRDALTLAANLAQKGYTPAEGVRYTGVGNAFKELAQLIKGGANVRIATIGMGGGAE